MSWHHDDKSTHKQLIRDVADKHCPDSVRQTAYQELVRRGVSPREAQEEADRTHGDFWGGLGDADWDD